MFNELKKVFQRQELVKNLVIKQLKVRYKSSSLGFLWSLLNPLLMMLVYSAVFSRFVRGGTEGIDNYAAFLITGLFTWNFFAGSLSDSVNAFIGNASLIKKVYFPRIILPVSSVLTNLINYILSLAVVFLLLILWGVYPNWTVIYLPAAIFIMILICAGFSFFLATLNVVFRDIEHMIQVILLAWFFLTPVIYSYETMIPVRYHRIYLMNPMAGLIISFQKILYFGEAPPLNFLLLPLLFGSLLFTAGYYFMAKLEGIVVEHM
jgi:lipopolysaccharide transport system permease protein